MKLRISSFVVLLSFLFASQCAASLVGTDNASASAYSDGWDSGDNGSITNDAAFDAWSLSISGGFGPRFLRGNSTSLANPGADINSAGYAFELTSASGYAFAQRPFSSPLTVGQTFSIDLAVNDKTNGIKGINLYDVGNGELFTFNVGSGDYRVSGVASNPGSIGNTYSANTTFALSFTQTSESGGTWKVVRSGGESSTKSGNYGGVPFSFRLYIGETGGGNERELFANNLAITAVPEPAAILFGGLICSVFGLAVVGRRALVWLHGKNPNTVAN